MAREKDMIRAIGILGLLALAAGGAYGGSLSLSWAPNQDEATAGYELEVVDAAGHVLNVYDVRSATHFTVPGLADGEVRHFRVRPYDRWGHRAATPSADIATMPAPRIDSLEGWTPVNGAFRVAVVGANFAPDARLVARWSGLTVLSATAQSSTRIVAEISVAPEAGSPLPEDFLVVNSVRRSDTFLAAHPEILDINQSGVVDGADLALVTAGFGARVGDSRRTVAPEMDLNGDGVVDGEDLALFRSFLAAHPDGVNLTKPRSEPQI